jgi:hypothetical protein
VVDVTALGRFAHRIGLASVVAAAILSSGDMVAAELLQSSSLVTQVYPEIVAKTFIPHSADPARITLDPRDESADAKRKNTPLGSVDYAEILGRQFARETDRRKYDLTDMEVQALVSDVTFRARPAGALALFDYRLDEHDIDLLADYQEDVLREAADEAIQEIGWLDRVENRMQSLFTYEIYEEGAQEREYMNRDFAWEDRKDLIRHEETTVVLTEPGERRPYEAHYGLSLLNIGTSSGSFIEAPSAYVRWEKLKIADKVKVKVQPMQEVSVSLRNSINKRWYWQHKALLDEGFDPIVRLSVTRRDEVRRNRITFFTEFGEHGRVGITFGALL